MHSLGYLAEAMAAAGWDPLLVHVVVDHDAGAGCRYALLWPLVTETKNKHKLEYAEESLPSYIK